MDIHRWLDDTADREPPDEQRHTVPDHMQTYAGAIDQDSATKLCRRKRKRASSDSSLLEYARHEHAKEMRYARPTEHVRDTAPTARRNRLQDRSLSEGSSPRAEQHKSYERRPRHKTKADRYEPKKRHERQHSPREKPASKRRASHRSVDSGRPTGVVQSFQLKNGPKNSRLTLKPDLTAGIFRHGRASAQVPPGGAGLPDLVFNEMRFLQKPKDHQDKTPARPDNEAATKKDRQQRREEEISAYFTVGRDAAQHDHPRQRNSRDPPCKEKGHRLHQRSAARPPPVDLPEKPFLGFGSKGQHATTQEPTTNSNCTWSDSQTPKPKSIPPRAKKRVSEPKPTRRSTEPIEACTREKRVPRRATTKTILPSAPHTMPSEPPIHVSLSADEESLPHDSSMFHTSDILRVHRNISVETPEENQQSASSTPTGKLLRKAFEAVHRPAAKESTFSAQQQRKRRESAITSDRILTPALRIRPLRPTAVSSTTASKPRPVQMYEEMLEEPGRKQDLVSPVHIYANAQQAEALAFNPIFQQPNPMHDGYGEQMRESGDLYEVGATPTIRSPLMSQLYVGPQEDFGPVSGGYDAHDYVGNARDEGFAGFWRPNRLY
ncbi:hypothetical protein LTR78_004401 [Recurvomyces mirabilis]|uniref:Uncharacterized protein n=1 Tax=Recurvomyces mirabilis TaxID=574656 RepID=A0AAE1C2R0_9PEZI|nr:hypothetical protein LTR78_004401 [Recurvomyces mirabilis]KAK5155933.1 hypothetical protein LTS14_005499 [Recurvomyces mirabilis]